MITIEMKVNAIMRYLTAATEHERAEYGKLLDKMMEGIPGNPQDDLRSQIHEVLRKLGIPDHISGHKYLCTAIEMACNDPGLLESVTGELYPAVAEANNSTWRKVERAIRYSITLCFSRYDTTFAWSLFKDTVSMKADCPTASAFIARLANYVATGK